ncbi:peptidyl-prolyl cis-trans isomerase [Paenibacillus qinlingensis]|uniref:peptidylprolyl isomerase n=1 Tax=Paenibacillus qinlingensis TaxID=1837343 RepID=UPI001565483A|nr:peptidylprolyl isomerase [Paenibacillus qinlingensis]NQX59799.1 peptidyl-prolyl cis-trans isomerase [Paenibacillus qinlingensis]
MKIRVTNGGITTWRLLFFFISLLCLLMTSCGNSSQSSTVAWVDGIPIEKGEMLRVMNQNRSYVFNYFHDKYGAENSPSFWEGRIGGEVPKELLKKKALDTLIRIKVEDKLANDEHLNNTLDYKSFLTAWLLENKRRKETVAKGGVIYGPAQFDEGQYFEYSHSKMKIELKDAWANTKQIKEELLREEYEATKEARYREPDHFRLEIISLPYNESNRDSSLYQLEQVVNSLKNCSEFSLMLSNQSQAHYEEITYTQGQDSAESKYPSIWNAIKELKVGETSKIVDERSTWVLFHVKERQPGQYLDYNKVRNAVRNQYIEQQLGLLIRERVEQAQIIINQKIYKSLSV